MFWGKTVFTAAALGVAAFGLAGAEPARAGVVVKSTGPSSGQFPVGKKLADADTITLRAGDVVTVLTDSGTRVLKGPGTHRVGARGASRNTAFAMLTRQRSGARVRTGAVRGDGATTGRNTNLWNIDISRPGRYCLARGATYDMWRPSAQDQATYILGSAVSDYEVQVTFAEGEQTAQLASSQLPLTENRIYDLSGPNGGASQRVEFVVLDDISDSPEDMALTLAQMGCNSQLDLLADTLSAG